MTNNQRKAAFVKLLHYYTDRKDGKFLCSFISDLLNQKLMTKGEATLIRAMISAELNHYFSSVYLHQVIERKRVKVLFFFSRLETQRELRIRWIRSQIEKFNV